MSDKRCSSNSYVYFFRNPVYATKERPEYFRSLIMGRIWLKAISRDSFKEKYGMFEPEEICNNDCDDCDDCDVCGEYVLETEDEFDIDEE